MERGDGETLIFPIISSQDDATFYYKYIRILTFSKRKKKKKRIKNRLHLLLRKYSIDIVKVSSRSMKFIYIYI